MMRGWSLALIILPAIAGGGCSTPVQIQPGLSAIRIEVKATPKHGYKRPATSISANDGAYDMESDGATDSRGSGPFKRVNYRAMDDIVVWIEPRFDAIASEPARDDPPVTVNLNPRSDQRRDVPLFVVGVNGRIEFVNRSNRDEVIYSLSDSNSFDLGLLPPNGKASYRPTSAGLIEVLCESRDAPVALVYVAPTRWVKRARSRSDVVFTDLPPGRYRVTCWQRRLPGSNTNVTAVADTITQAVVSVGVNTLPKVD